MASKIVPLLPEHTVYVEPFAGGAAIFYAKPTPDVKNADFYREVLNDSSEDLINMYRVAKLQPREFWSAVDATMYSQAEYRRTVEILRKPDKYDRLTRAWAYYLNMHASFAGKTSGGWAYSCCSVNLASTWNKRNPLAQLERLRNAFICCEDALTVIQKFDSPQTLFYCDPPYIGTSMGHYKGYNENNFHDLLRTLNACCGSYVLSCYMPCKDLLKGQVDEMIFSSHCTASGKGKAGKGRNKSFKSTSETLGDRKRIERVYRRFNTVPWRPELEKLRQAGKYSCFARNPKELPYTKSKQGSLL